MQKFGGVFSRIAVTKNGIACNQEIGAGANHIADRFEIDSTIDFDAERQAARLANARQRFNFPQ